MPTYEYRCAEGHLFDQFQRMTEPPVEKCPVCGAKAERLLKDHPEAELTRAEIAEALREESAALGL